MNEIQNTDRCFFTQQVFLIGTYNEDKTCNFAPISWISYTAGEKSCLVISMGGDKQTKRNIMRTGLLSATVLTKGLLPFAECCNNYTQNDSLIESVKPEIVNGNCLDVPLIKNAAWSYECKVIQTVQLGESHTFFAEFAKVNVRQDILSLDFIDLCKINPIIYSPNNYFSVGEHLGEIGDFSKATIRTLSVVNLPEYADVIRKSFATVAQDFGLTKENCPYHPSFISNERLAENYIEGYYPFGLYLGNTIIGFVSITDSGNDIYEMSRLSILPEYRHYGYGKKMMDFCKEKVCELGGKKIEIEIVEENEVLKDWYSTNGFVHTGIDYYDGLPFTIGKMEWEAAK